MKTVISLVAVLVLGGVGLWVGLGQNGGASPPGTPAPAAAPKTATVGINGTTFELDLALDDKTRFKGLSGRDKVEDKGGMLFVFPRIQNRLEFVMRDCLIPIDIIYLDGGGRVVSWHKMTPEPPRADDEKELKPPFNGAPDWAWTNDKYERRLKRYSSKFSAQFVIEIAGGKTDSLNLKAGQKLDLDVARLKRLAQ
jgi:uncharacterized protein